MWIRCLTLLFLTLYSFVKVEGTEQKSLSSQDSKFVVRTYRPGDEVEEARISLHIAKNWVWPSLHSLKEVRSQISGPSFDPRSRIYAFYEGKMVAFTEFVLYDSSRFTPKRALLFYPRCLPEFHDAAEPLILKAVEILHRELDQNLIQIRVTTMISESIEVVKRCKFYETEDRPIGYKIYYTYDLTQGDIKISTDMVEDFVRSRDLDEAARIAWMWYKQPVEWCRENLLSRANQYNSFAHLVVRHRNEIIAACFIAPNYYTGKETIAALFYQYALMPEALRPMIAEAIKRSRKAGFKTLVVDVIYDHLYFAPTYRALGFKKAAEMGVFERRADK